MYIPELRYSRYSIQKHENRDSCSLEENSYGMFFVFPTFSINIENYVAPINFFDSLPSNLNLSFMEGQFEYSDEESIESPGTTNTSPTVPSTSSSSINSPSESSHFTGESFEIDFFGSGNNVTSDLLSGGVCIVDSGASSHMIHERSAFLSYVPTPKAFVTVANDEKIPCVRRGTAIFYLRDKLKMPYSPSLSTEDTRDAALLPTALDHTSTFQTSHSK